MEQNAQMVQGNNLGEFALGRAIPRATVCSGLTFLSKTKPLCGQIINPGLKILKSTMDTNRNDAVAATVTLQNPILNYLT